MDPSTGIPPMRAIRRPGKQKWHLWSDESYPWYGTLCGQSISMAEEKTAYNAAEIGCTDCLVEAIGRAR